MKNIYILVFFFIFINFSAFSWGPTGHRATGEIAQQNLSKKAEKAIENLLEGQSLALVSTFGDDIKSDKQYWKYSAWHYVNIPFGTSYNEYPKNKDGDIVYGITKAIEVLKDAEATREDQIFYLKMLVHFIGDLHQPLHVGIADDKGGNDFQVRWFNQGTNLHRVWDSQILESYGMSYSELSTNVKKLTKEEKKNIQSGDFMDWLNDSRELMEDIYKHTEIGEKLGYEYMYRYMDTLRFQLQKGGLRLASLLNEIYK